MEGVLLPLGKNVFQNETFPGLVQSFAKVNIDRKGHSFKSVSSRSQAEGNTGTTKRRRF